MMQMKIIIILHVYLLSRKLIQIALSITSTVCFEQKLKKSTELFICVESIVEFPRELKFEIRKN